MKIKALIVEDNLNAAEVLEKILSQFPEIQLVGTSTTKEDAISKINYFKPDLLFLDIQLGQFKSFDVLLACKNCYKFIIFITAYEQYALKAYEYNTIHYILKPIIKEDIVAAFEKIKQLEHCKFESTESDFKLFTEVLNKKPIDDEQVSKDIFYYFINKQWKSVSKKDIIYLLGESSYTNLKTKDNNFIKVSKNLKTVGESFLQLPNFIRVQKKYIVNIDYIETVSRGLNSKITMKNLEEIPISILLKDKLFGRIGIVSKQNK